MTGYYRGDIVWADLDPVRSGEQGKLRPCVIVSNDALNQSKHPCVIVCPITDKATEHRKYSTHVVLTVKDGLEKDSVILAEQVRAIAKSRITDKEVVHIPDVKKAELEIALKDALDLI